MDILRDWCSSDNSLLKTAENGKGFLNNKHEFYDTSIL